MPVFFLFITLGLITAVILFFSKKKSSFYYDNSIDSDAIILSIHLTGICIKSDIQAIIQLQVMPERGKSFISETKGMISAIEYTQAQPGTKIRVKYQPRNYKEVMILRDSFSRTY